jgi:hypothetical protein
MLCLTPLICVLTSHILLVWIMGLVCLQTACLMSFIFVLLFKKNLTSRHFSLFYFLYYINNFFITIQIKKIYFNTIFFFTFTYKFFLLYITSTTFSTTKKINQLNIPYQTSPIFLGAKKILKKLFCLLQFK